MGRAVDRRPPSAGVVFGALFTLAGWCVLVVAGKLLAGLVAGVVLLDVGVQAGHVANQARIYKAFPVARSRANTAYMVSYFVGGATGSILGAHAWTRSDGPASASSAWRSRRSRASWAR